LGLQR